MSFDLLWFYHNLLLFLGGIVLVKRTAMFQMMAACNETMIIYDQLYDIINAEAAT